MGQALNIRVFLIFAVFELKTFFESCKNIVCSLLITLINLIIAITSSIGRLKNLLATGFFSNKTFVFKNSSLLAELSSKLIAD